MIFSPRYKKQAKELLHGARKLYRYRKDILEEKRLRFLEEGIGALEGAMKSGGRSGVEEATRKLDAICLEIAPPRKDAGWRENCEVFLVAIVVAAAIKAYYLQPFKIPTGSMQPTLNGIIGYPEEVQAPNVVARVWEFIWNGRNYIDLVSEVDGNRVLELRKVQRFHFFTFTKLVCKDGVHTLFAAPETLVKDFGVSGTRTYDKGEVIARGYIDTGDQVFVDKVTYHFRKPERGEVFVFKTTGIRKIEERLDPAMGSQFYIKRLVGLPGDRLVVDPPLLLVDGEPADEFGIRRVASAEYGYRGYSNTSEEGGRFEFLGDSSASFKVPSRSYFAMGDNSFNSSDSRHWGIVPEKNVVGRGFFVYWPFGQNWGLID